MILSLPETLYAYNSNTVVSLAENEEWREVLPNKDHKIN